jgi:hypothetical protein
LKRFILGVSGRFCFVYIKNVLFFVHYGVTEKTLFMSALIISNILILGGTALAAAIVLYIVSQKFRVEENPKIAEIEALLPGANCGACGKAGCHAFAVACANSSKEQFKELFCTAGGKEVMDKVAAELGYVAAAREPTVAVLKCNGTCQNAPDKVVYTGMKSCRMAARVSVGRSGCPNGCLRFGDCVRACPFGAIRLDETTGIPVVDENKCTSCGACVRTCPRGLYEIRPKGKNGVRVYVACSNTQKGALARKNCKAACIACMKCVKICPDVRIENNLSYIPPAVSPDEFGTRLAEACPTGAIICTGGKTSTEAENEQ